MKSTKNPNAMFKPQPEKPVSKIPAVNELYKNLKNELELLIDHITNSKKYKENHPLNDFVDILNEVILQMAHSKGQDHKTLFSLVEYIKSIPVQTKDGTILSFGEYKKIHESEPIEMIKLHTGKPLSGESLKELEEFYNNLLVAYEPVYHWEYAYVPNENGEIMSPEFENWQVYMTEAKFTKKPDESIYDFERNTTIHNERYKKSRNPKEDVNIINQKINSLCDELKNTDKKDKELYAAWLKKCGGQKTHGYLTAPFDENHFGNNIGLGKSNTKSMDWTIKNNQLVSTYSAEIRTLNSLDSGDQYSKPQGQPIIQTATNPDDIEYLMKNLDKLDPLIKVNGKVVLTIKKDENNHSMVIPKLVELKLDCSSCITKSGVLLHNPKENKHLNQLTPENHKPLSGLKND